MCDENGRELWLRVAKPLPPGNPVHAWLARDYAVCHAMLIRRNALAESGLWDPSLKGAEDRDLWLRLASSGARFLAVPEACVAYRRYDASTTANFETIYFSARRVLARHAKHHGNCADCRRSFREGMRGMRKYCLDGNFWHTLRRHEQSHGRRGALRFVLNACCREPALVPALARHAFHRGLSKLRRHSPQPQPQTAPQRAAPIPGGAHP
jgi:GT2 family glycosyltransferase